MSTDRKPPCDPDTPMGVWLSERALRYPALKRLSFSDLYNLGWTGEQVDRWTRPQDPQTWSRLNFDIPVEALISISHAHPDLCWGDAFEWVLAQALVAGPEEFMDGLPDLIEAWGRAGYRDDGWVFLAAGISLAEALRARRDGTPITVQDARVLAGLRGSAADLPR